MKTQTLLLSATALCAGALTAFGAVSSNVVGYTNTKVAGKKLALIANTLDNKAGNRIADSLKGAPDGSYVYTYGAGYVANQYLGENTWGDDDAVIAPGTGFFFQNAAATEATIQFVGEVKQGVLSTPVPNGLSIRASQVPQAGKVDALGLALGAGDKIYTWSGTGFVEYQYLGEDTWSTDDGFAPAVGVGESVFINNISGTTTWSRTFNVPL